MILWFYLLCPFSAVECDSSCKNVVSKNKTAFLDPLLGSDLHTLINFFLVQETVLVSKTDFSEKAHGDIYAHNNT